MIQGNLSRRRAYIPLQPLTFGRIYMILGADTQNTEIHMSSFLAPQCIVHHLTASALEALGGSLTGMVQPISFNGSGVGAGIKDWDRFVTYMHPTLFAGVCTGSARLSGHGGKHTVDYLDGQVRLIRNGDVVNSADPVVLVPAPMDEIITLGLLSAFPMTADSRRKCGGCTRDVILRTAVLLNDPDTGKSFLCSKCYDKDETLEQYMIVDGRSIPQNAPLVGDAPISIDGVVQLAIAIESKHNCSECPAEVSMRTAALWSVSDVGDHLLCGSCYDTHHAHKGLDSSRLIADGRLIPENAQVMVYSNPVAA
jgi:hypothetical protein